jgi:hypothetical protein
MGSFHSNVTPGSVLTKAGRWKLVKAASVRLFLSVAVHVLSSLPPHNFPTDPAWLLLIAAIPEHRYYGGGHMMESGSLGTIRLLATCDPLFA